jgi:hypothetical protein
MKQIYNGMDGWRLTPDLFVETDKTSRFYGWLFCRHPDGSNLTSLANVLKAFEPESGAEGKSEKP